MLPFEIPIRLAAFAGVFALMAVWELLAPRRQQAAERPLRWSSNLGIVVLDTVLVRILVPATGVGIAFLAEARGWGLFHAFAAPAWLARPTSVMSTWMPRAAAKAPSWRSQGCQPATRSAVLGSSELVSGK